MSKTTKKAPLTNYRSVSRNIYFDGSSYRVRVIKNGVRYSQNFSSKKAAVEYRNSITN